MNAFLILLLIVLVGRFAFLSERRAVSKGPLLAQMGITAAATYILFTADIRLHALVLVLLATQVLLFCMERKGDGVQISAGWRCATMLIQTVAILAVGYGESAVSLRIQWNLSAPVLSVVCSLVLAAKESNYFIRWFFSRYCKVDSPVTSDQDTKTENGRIIGTLERLLLLLFFWEGTTMAATIIVAIKGLARFKKMEESQAFAEYVIIGTFLSVLVSIVIYRVFLLLG